MIAMNHNIMVLSSNCMCVFGAAT